MQQVENSSYPSNVLGRVWLKTPLILRSVLLGFTISTFGIGIWTVIVSSIPGPWSVLLMGIILIFFWRYFSGQWKPSNTQLFRRFCTRQITLKRSVWIWGLVAALCIVLFLHSSFTLTFRIVQFQPEIFKNLSFINDLPALQSWSIIIGISMVAGICEEIGYRGYLQKPLEQKYGPVIAISISSLVFIVIHLNQSWLASIVVPVFFISIMIGSLTYVTNSLLPGIAAHFTFDIINVSYWWSDTVSTFDYKPISVTGVDSHFIYAVVAVLLSGIMFIFTLRKLWTLNIEDSTG